MHRLRVDWERIYIMEDKNSYYLNKLTRISSMLFIVHIHFFNELYEKINYV